MRIIILHIIHTFRLFGESVNHQSRISHNNQLSPIRWMYMKWPKLDKFHQLVLPPYIRKLLYLTSKITGFDPIIIKLFNISCYKWAIFKFWWVIFFFFPFLYFFPFNLTVWCLWGVSPGSLSSGGLWAPGSFHYVALTSQNPFLIVTKFDVKY